MSILLMKMLQPYRDENGGDGGDAGGGAPDRGDALDDLPSATETTAEATAAADAQAAEDLKTITGDKGDGGEAKDDTLRDENGKFAKKDKAVVPKARFDEAVNKEREAREAAERRAAEAEAKLKQEEKSADVAKMEEEVEKLEAAHAKYLLDGEAEKAAATMKQIRQTERQIAKLESSEESSRATALAVEQVRMDAAIAKLEAEYPVFNKESETFDQDLVDIVLGEQSRLMQTQRLAPSAALLAAANKIMKKFGPKETSNETTGLAAAKTTADDRKTKQVEKNLDTAKRQPASTKDTGLDSDKAGVTTTKIDVNKLTPEEYAALPEATKARLRGDLVDA